MAVKTGFRICKGVRGIKGKFAGFPDGISDNALLQILVYLVFRQIFPGMGHDVSAILVPFLAVAGGAVLGTDHHMHIKPVM